jgi:hypothetical protein
MCRGSSQWIALALFNGLAFCIFPMMQEELSSKASSRHVWTLLTSVGQVSENTGVEQSHSRYQPFVTDGVVGELEPLSGKQRCR